MCSISWRRGLLVAAVLVLLAANLRAVRATAPDEIDPETAAATQEDLIDPSIPRDAGEPRSLTPPQTEAAPLGTAKKAERASAEAADVTPTAGTTPATDPANDGEALVRRAFAQSKTAKDEASFSEMLDLCAAGVQSGLSGAMVPYTRQFMGWAHNRRGELRSDAGHNDEALDDFATAVRLDETKWRHFHNRGVALATLGKYDAAIADFDQTVRMNPGYANAYFNRGELRYENKQFPDAIRDYTAAIRLAPRDAAAYNSRGHAYYRLERFREALDDYNQAIRLDPAGAAAYTNRGDAYADLGRYAEAAHDYRAAIKINPNLGRAYQSTAWLMSTCPDESYRNAALAVEVAQKAILLDGDNDYRYLETLAAAEANAGDFDAAAATQKKVIELAPAEVRERATARLEAYRQKSPYREAARAAAGTRSATVVGYESGSLPEVRPLER